MIIYKPCTKCKQPCTDTVEDKPVCDPCKKRYNPCADSLGRCEDTPIVKTIPCPTPCTEGCEETIKSDCVILDNYCLVNECNCEDPVNLSKWIEELCKENELMWEKVRCLQLQNPLCNTMTCNSPSILDIKSNNTAITVNWNPANNDGQKIAYKIKGTTVWNYTTQFNPLINNHTISNLVSNEMYDIKLIWYCNGAELSTGTFTTFTASNTNWSVKLLGKTDVGVYWNFTGISNVTSLKITLYKANVLVSTQTIIPSLIGNYKFLDLDLDTNFEIVVGEIYSSSITFPENAYTVGGVEFITPLQSQSEYKRKFKIKTPS